MVTTPEAWEWILTVMVDLLLYTGFTWPIRRVPTDVREVLCYLVHLMTLEICDDNVDLVAATVVHAAKEHKLRELTQRTVGG